jgi:hypothetical protein
LSTVSKVVKASSRKWLVSGRMALLLEEGRRASHM